MGRRGVSSEQSDENNQGHATSSKRGQSVGCTSHHHLPPPPFQKTALAVVYGGDWQSPVLWNRQKRDPHGTGSTHDGSVSVLSEEQRVYDPITVQRRNNRGMPVALMTSDM